MYRVKGKILVKLDDATPNLLPGVWAALGLAVHAAAG